MPAEDCPDRSIEHALDRNETRTHPQFELTVTGEQSAKYDTLIKRLARFEAWH
jgi:hypothetical protein